MKTIYLIIALAIGSLLMALDSAADSYPGHVLKRRASAWLFRNLRDDAPRFQNEGPTPPCEIAPRTDGQLAHAKGW